MGHVSRFRSTFFIGLQLFGLSLIISLATSRMASAATTYQVSGVVSNGGTPISSVSVSATAPGTSTVIAGPSITGVDGTYSLNLGEGAYDLHYVRIGSGYTSLTRRNVVVQGDVALDTSLRATSSSRVLSGKVTDQYGNPVPYIGVMPSGASGNWADTSGRFSLNLSATTYSFIKFQGLITGYSIVAGNEMTYPDYGNAGAFSVNLINGDVIQDFKLNLVKLNIVAKDYQGNPAVGAKITYNFGTSGTTTVNSGNETYSLNVNSISVGSAQSKTGSDGVYTLLVPKGGYFNPEGKGRTLCVQFVDLTSRCHNQAINASSDVTIEINERQSHTVSGTVRDEHGNPIPNIGVEAYTDEAWQVRGVWTDASGYYSLTLPAAVYDNIKLRTCLGGTCSTVGHEMATPDLGAPGEIVLDLSNSDVVKNFLLDNMVKLKVVAKDSSGNSQAGIRVWFNFQEGNFGKTNVTSGGNVFPLTIAGFTSKNSPFPVTDINGEYTAYVPSAGRFTPGQAFSRGYMCLVFQGGPITCGNSGNTFDTGKDVTFLFNQGRPILSTPLPPSLDITSPARYPVLSWGGAPGASSYKVFRDGVQITTVSTETFTDNDAELGTHEYRVSAINAAGEGLQSNAAIVEVSIDTTPPTIEYTMTPELNVNGWAKEAVLVRFQCADTNGSGVASCSWPALLSNEATGQTVSGMATDNAGNTANVTTVPISIDYTRPTVSNVAWTRNPLLAGLNTTISAQASDALSGVQKVEYSLDGGAPQPMTYDAASASWNATFGADLPVNTYSVAVYATDKAGNMSNVINDVLPVYTTTNGYVTGHAKTLPTASDVLPIALDTSSSPAKLVVGFTNVMAPVAGSFDMSYVIKNNKDAFSLSSTAISWVVVQDPTHATIQGLADLTTYINGIKTTTSNAVVKFDVALGTSGAPDQISIKIFNPELNPNTDMPTYTINNQVITNGSNLMIHP